MFGIGKKNLEIIDEAVLMLDGLAEDVSSGAVGKLVTRPLPQAMPVAATTLLAAEDIATRPIDLPTDSQIESQNKPDNELF
jgi:hypothetical protein